MSREARRSDLLVRTVSAVVMLAVAGTAVWMGGLVFTFFVALVAFLTVLEWRGLVVRFPDDGFTRGVWMMIGGLYAAFGCAAVLWLYDAGFFLPVLAAVIATDVGAYFSGRTIGGPKIAPAISPSKTWAGLIGGMTAAAIVMAVMDTAARASDETSLTLLLVGALLAMVAQAGDFFESWMKRRAGVKDSGTLLPGHGGIFDRVDGLLPACILACVLLRTGIGL